MELLVLSLSLWILQSNTAAADSIIHIGKGASRAGDRWSGGGGSGVVWRGSGGRVAGDRGSCVVGLRENETQRQHNSAAFYLTAALQGSMRS